MGTTTVTNREHYERVVATFEVIRNLMELDTEYAGDWDVMEAEFNRIFRVFDPDDWNPGDGSPEGVFVSEGELLSVMKKTKTRPWALAGGSPPVGLPNNSLGGWCV